MNKAGQVVLIPTFLDEAHLEPIPAYVTAAVKTCTVFFVENEKSARRYLKQLWREMVIDDYKWYAIHKAEDQVKQALLQHLRNGDTIGIISEAGCPGIADPGQILVAAAQENGFAVKPLTGPSSILLALMASGMNGQRFQFHGYLPIDAIERKKVLKELEADSRKRNCTQIFIETPYRNNQLIADVLQACQPNTLFCIAVDITGDTESIRTQPIKAWAQKKPDIHKRPAIFLLQG